MTELRPNELEHSKKRGKKILSIGRVFNYPYAFCDLLARANDLELDSKTWHLFWSLRLVSLSTGSLTHTILASFARVAAAWI
ncbi:hypothetical protein Poly51_45430 [Rubripirellula tenax]|uniref:Uncharacterized protein n=1 Tax=Rubripirellula tenax TaxID=2528015 RepID=A0A5C6EHZ2_9BACT|nr:hypothetical protein [Rubripirellula tenax]TWU48642.1 hypothetical protein Poly51_45430 [Rubripirellula tenax]